MLGGNHGAGIETDAIELVAGEIASLHAEGIEVGVVVGGGNFFRGSLADKFGMDRAAADYMGMLATCINGLALQAVLENKFNLHTRVLTAIHMPELAEPYIRRKAIKHLSEKRIVIFSGGTGNPLFTTDTAASLRALEVSCELILKATKVDGIYEKDPKLFPGAKKIDNISYIDVISKKLGVMDATAITMCMEAEMPVRVIKMDKPGCVLKALRDPSAGTTVS